MTAPFSTLHRAYARISKAQLVKLRQKLSTLLLRVRTAHLRQEPGTGKVPVPDHSGSRHIQNLGGFLKRESPEKSQFHNFCFTRLERRKALQGLIEGDQLLTPARRDDGGFIQALDWTITAPPLIAPGPSMVDKNLPHNPRTH